MSDLRARRASRNHVTVGIPDQALCTYLSAILRSAHDLVEGGIGVTRTPLAHVELISFTAGKVLLECRFRPLGSGANRPSEQYLYDTRTGLAAPVAERR